MHYILDLFAVVLCGLGYRIRGGWLHETLPRPGQVSRVVFGVTGAIAALAGGAVWWHALALVPALWACTTLPLIGSIGLQRPARDIPLLCLRGALAVALAVPILWWFAYPHWWAALVPSSFMGVAYWLAKKTPITAPGFGRGGDFPEIGELYSGMLIGLGLVLACG